MTPMIGVDDEALEKADKVRRIDCDIDPLPRRLIEYTAKSVDNCREDKSRIKDSAEPATGHESVQE